MNKIGNMYQVKKWYWLLFPNKTLPSPSHAGSFDAGISAALVDATAAFWSKQYNCNITYLSPNDILVLLETDGNLKKVLSTNGDIGWTWLSEGYNDCFEEVSAG